MHASCLIAGLGLLVLASVPAAAKPHHQVEVDPGPTVSAAPGTIVRWSAPGTKTCGMGKRSWPALRETCYYPVDLLENPGAIKVTRSGHGRTEAAQISVQPFDYPTQSVDLGNIPQADPTHEEMKRAKREEAQTERVFMRKDGPARFALPLGAPAKPLPEGRDFGSKRVFNDTPAGQPHMGADYTINLGTPVHAVGDGRVALAADQFFAGNAVYIDHGDGLVTEYFHLSKIKVKAGQRVRKGQTIGLVGDTGRSTGAHLFFGARWHNARINPELLLGDPAKIQSVDSAAAMPAEK
ncbi:MAG TPA: M23 family metallopeptidase [Alphaproteobacteria bacterium]|jgi:murein DD-endopeptidase MepM/ murein hydrolase activator NlpD|nr:M23 family metallopeptidase [Alphaproteobacteria bacterium]